jgi:fibronectin type 3 domain-containing protein
MRTSMLYALSISLALNLFTGCGKMPVPEKVITVDPTLPVPSLNGSLSDITSTAFEWKAIEDPRVSGYYVYRSSQSNEDKKLQRIATIESRYATHFVDDHLVPNTQYQYRFSSKGKTDTESPASETMSVNTLPMIAPVSFFQSVGNMPRSAKLLWRPHPNAKINSYIIDRLNVNDQKWSEIATVTGRLNAEFIDRDLKDGQIYYYRVRAVTYDKLITEPSEISKLSTKPLPPEIKNITSTSDLPKAIALSWEPSGINDLNHYNIYRSSTSDGSYSYHVKLNESKFTDTTKEDGEIFFYKITAVDKDDLESPQSTPIVQGSSLVKPKTPTTFDGKIGPNGVDLTWINSDPRAVSYTVIKTTKKSWVDRVTVEINSIADTKFHDGDVNPNIEYLYEVISVDKDGIRSLPTLPIALHYETK